MSILKRFAEGLAKLLAVVAALGLLILVLLLTIDLFGRNIFGFTTTFANEWSSFVNGAVILLAAPFAFVKGDHIRVELAQLLRRRRLRLAVIAFADLLCLMIALYLCYAIAVGAWEAYATDRRSTWVLRTPLWIPQAALSLGAVAFVFVAVHHFLRTLRSLWSHPGQ